MELHRVSAIDWRKQLQGRDGRSAKTILAWFPISGELYFTKNLANNAGYDPTSFTGEAGGTISNQFHPGLDYGNVSFSHRHRFLATFLYELPVGKNRRFERNANGVLDRVIGGWEVAGVVVVQTGPYMTVLAGNDPSGTGFPELVGDGRADVVSGISPYAGQSLSRWINPAAFVTPPDNIGRFGNEPVGSPGLARRQCRCRYLRVSPSPSGSKRRSASPQPTCSTIPTTTCPAT